jgi:hypothetical protein
MKFTFLEISSGIILLFFCPSLFSQRIIDESQYTKIYFDSVRATVSDTTKELYVIRAFRLQRGQKILIEGMLDEEAWQQADHGNNFFEKDPYPLVKPSDPTEFSILYDDENIYIGVWCWESEPEKIVKQLSPRGTTSGDNIELYFDTFHDKRTGYKFTVSSTGVQMDELRYDDFKRDFNWNGVWDSAAKIDNRGWYIEVKIPIFNFRFKDKSEHTWGFNILRHHSKNASMSIWKPHLPEWELYTRMSTLGDVTGIRGIKTGRQFEIRPYGVAGFSQTANTAADTKLGNGVDLRFSPSTSITADVTINPDFAQVDADVLVINLTRFPTRFTELRPFFTERTNIFNTPIELFYSRRIGARGDIAGGVKLTGKTNNGFEFGAVGCMVGDSPFSNLQSHITHPEEANFGVIRIKKDWLRSSSFGLLVASKEKNGEYNRVFGLDGSIVITNNHLLDFQIAEGKTPEKSQNNFAYLAAFRKTGDEFGFTADFSRYEPYFEVNDVGYLTKEKYRGWNELKTTFRFSPRINKHSLRRIHFEMEVEGKEDLFTNDYLNNIIALDSLLFPHPKFGKVSEGKITTGERKFRNWHLKGEGTLHFLNEYRLSYDYLIYKEMELTGPYFGKTWGTTFSSRSTSQGARISTSLGVSLSDYYNFDQKYVGFKRSLFLSSRGRITTNILTNLQGEYTQTFDPAQQNDGRYWQFSSNTTFMFTKDFYFRLHLQGRFNTTTYETKLTQNQYLLSILVSWEYRPGCFFYLAYNEGRFDYQDRYLSDRFKFNDRTLVSKLSYRFNL